MNQHSSPTNRAIRRLAGCIALGALGVACTSTAAKDVHDVPSAERTTRSESPVPAVRSTSSTSIGPILAPEATGPRISTPAADGDLVEADADLAEIDTQLAEADRDLATQEGDL